MRCDKPSYIECIWCDNSPTCTCEEPDIYCIDGRDSNCNKCGKPLPKEEPKPRVTKEFAVELLNKIRESEEPKLEVPEKLSLFVMLTETPNANQVILIRDKINEILDYLRRWK